MEWPIEMLSTALPRARLLAPLTPMQLRFWDFFQQGRTPSKRMCTVAMRVDGPLNVEYLRRSIDAIAQRHEALRTRIIVVNGVPLQQVDPPTEAQFDVVDISHAPPATINDRAAHLMDEFADASIDLSLGPLLAVRLFRLSQAEHILMFAIDHIISDHASTEVLSREVWLVYQQLAREVPLSLPLLHLQFPEYAIRQRETCDARLKRHERYWRERLADAQKLQIPSHGCPVQPSHMTQAVLEVQFGAALTARLRHIAQRERTLLPIVVLTLYVALLSEWCEQTDLVVPLVSHGRYSPELVDMIGLLVEVLFLRIDFSRQMTFLELLNEVHLEFFSAYEHRNVDLPSDLMQQHVGAIHFVYAQRSIDQCMTVDGQDIVVRSISARIGAGNRNRFQPVFVETPAGIYASVMYAPELFAKTSVEKFVRDLRSLAERCSREPISREVFSSEADSQ